jgi:alpha-beta hydrolase superfamily lysophospholipase
MAAEIGEYTTEDGLRLCYRHWRGTSEGNALIYLHGIESHSEWFAGCAEGIAEMGIAVYALDRRGSGMNPELRGHCRSYGQLVADIIRFEQSIKSAHREIHMAALSWGGKLAVAVDMLHPGVFSTMALIAPGFFPRVLPVIGERVSIAIDALFRPRRLHPIPIKDEMFTSIPEHLEYIRCDPLRLHEVTARFYFESVMLDRFLKRNRYQWTAPTQLLLAEHDEIVDSRRVQEMFQSVNAEPKKMSVYADCNHSLQFEQPSRVAKDIVAWMQSASKH